MRKFLVCLLALAMVCSLFLTSCGEQTTETEAETTQQEAAEATTYDVTIWVSETDGVKELTLTQIEAFNAANTDIQINATVEGVGEGDAATKMIADVETGADIFCFAQDQLARLIQAGALSALGQGTTEKVKAENSTGSVACATFGDTVYAFPITDDNGYFMYYDKSVISEDHVDSLEDIIADCEAAGKLFSFQLEGSAWYAASFFFGTGCVSTWTTDDNGEFVSVNDTFNSAEGLIALEGMQKLLKSACYSDSSSAADFSAATPSAVVVSGTWDYATASAALGENFGVADLPSFTVGENTYHLGSFSGCKLMGMKPQADSDKASAIQRLCYYLAGEECQKARFESFGWGPSNNVVAASDEVAQDPTLLALAAQNAYAQPQGQIHGSWWDIAKLVATDARAAEATTEGRQAVLDAYQASMEALFTMSDDTKNAFTVIGGIAESGWGTDFAMTKTAEADGIQTWVTDDTFTLAAGEEFKVRQGLSWDNALGATNGGTLSANDGNYAVSEAEAGSHKIQFVYNTADNTGTISIIDP